MSSEIGRLFDLRGSTAIVTGASSGIGEALARGIAASGARVVLIARRAERLDALAREIGSGGGSALALAADLSVTASLPALFDRIADWGGQPADLLVNNAGIAEPRSFLKTDAASFERVMQVNFMAPWHLTREFATRLVAAGRGGAVLNIGSVLGLGVGVGYSAYSASKAALQQMTRSLALELVGRRIRVNAIAPGWFETEMNREFFASEAGKAYRDRLPPGRLGELGELVGPALLLLGPGGSYVNGVVLPVDGGHSVALI